MAAYWACTVHTYSDPPLHRLLAPPDGLNVYNVFNKQGRQSDYILHTLSVVLFKVFISLDKDEIIRRNIQTRKIIMMMIVQLVPNHARWSKRMLWLYEDIMSYITGSVWEDCHHTLEYSILMDLKSERSLENKKYYRK